MAGSIQDFMLEDIGKLTEEVFPSKRFKTPFKIRAISEKRNEELRKKNTTVTLNKRLQRKEKSVNQDAYMADMVLECITFPDLKNAELQEHYGTTGNPSATLHEMVSAGEYANLVEAIQELNGFDSDVEQLREEAKND